MLKTLEEEEEVLEEVLVEEVIMEVEEVIMEVEEVIMEVEELFLIQ
jgi:hypothetical protein